MSEIGWRLLAVLLAGCLGTTNASCAEWPDCPEGYSLASGSCIPPCPEGHVRTVMGCEEAASLCTVMATDVIDFEGSNLLPAGFISTGNSPWQVLPQEEGEGNAAVSGSISHRESSTLEVTVFVAVSAMNSFDWFTDSERRYDELTFYVDDVETIQYSGIDSGTHEFALEPGVRRLKWVYSKDGSANVGEDQVGLYSLRLENACVLTEVPGG